MTYYEFRVEIFPVNEKSALETWLNELGKDGFRLASIENYVTDTKTLTKCVMTRSSSEKPENIEPINDFSKPKLLLREKPLKNLGEGDFPF